MYVVDFCFCGNHPSVSCDWLPKTSMDEKVSTASMLLVFNQHTSIPAALTHFITTIHTSACEILRELHGKLACTLDNLLTHIDWDKTWKKQDTIKRGMVCSEYSYDYIASYLWVSWCRVEHLPSLCLSHTTTMAFDVCLQFMYCAYSAATNKFTDTHFMDA